MTERKSTNPDFELEGPKYSVAFSENQMSTPPESLQSHDFGTSSLSREEEERAPVILASKDDLTCEKGYAGVKKQTDDTDEQSEVETPTISVSPPLHRCQREEEAENVEENYFTRDPLRKLNGECHDSNIDDGLPTLIRCFQVVTVSSEFLLFFFQISLLVFGMKS